jgi:hypothetical protein
MADKHCAADAQHATVVGRLQHVANDLGAVQAMVCQPPLVSPPIR